MTGTHEQQGPVSRTRLLMASAGVVGATGAVLLAWGLLGQAPPPSPPSALPAVVVAPGARAAPPVARSVALSLTASAPVSISIPTIALRSPVQRLGLTSSGALAVPAAGRHYDEVGWYTASPTPGEIGPSVLAGHVDSATTGPSVFWELATVRAGARIDIVRADSSVATFTVVSVSRYAKSSFPTDRVYGDTATAALRLITCGGPIDVSTGHYRDNVVVFAELTGVRRA